MPLRRVCVPRDAACLTAAGVGSVRLLALLYLTLCSTRRDFAVRFSKRAAGQNTRTIELVFLASSHA